MSATLVPASISITVPALQMKLHSLGSDTRPFQKSGDPKKESETHWVRPELVVEVEFTSSTSDGLLRQVSFKGMREDKDAKTVVVERPS
jgi:bifunctional non-homologous end joining protein LigD